jgi:hypothetical protein
MKRFALWGVLVIGVALIVFPVATGMFAKAAAGERVMKAFEPVMSEQSVSTSTQYYGLFKGVGTDFGPIMTQANVDKFNGYVDGIKGTITDSQKFIPDLAQKLNMTPAQVDAFLAQNYPALSAMLANMPQMQTDMGALVGIMARDVQGFGQVTPALQHFDGLIKVMQSNVKDFAKANELQPMGIMPWFLIGPGIVITLLAGWLLFAEYGRGTAVVAIGKHEEAVRAA